MHETNRNPPEPVRSTLLWNENEVRAKQTATVIPAAIRTECASKNVANVPTTIPSANVKITRSIKFEGAFLRKSSEQAKASMTANVTPKATYRSQ